MGWNQGRHPLDPEPQKPKLPPEIWERLPVWREKWAEIWYVRVSGAHYVYRSPTRQEILEFDMNSPTSFGLAADRVIKSCLLYPEKLSDSMSFGAFVHLFEAIWSTSGFSDPEEFEAELASYEESVRSEDQLNMALILRAFPGLLPDTVNSWQHEKLIYHLALAKMMLGIEPEAKARRRPKLQIQTEPSTPPPSGPSSPKVSRFDWEKDKAELEAFLRKG